MSLINIEQYGCQWVCIIYGERIIAFSKDECYEKVIIFLMNKLRENYFYYKEEDLVL